MERGQIIRSTQFWWTTLDLIDETRANCYNFSLINVFIRGVDAPILPLVFEKNSSTGGKGKKKLR